MTESLWNIIIISSSSICTVYFIAFWIHQKLKVLFHFILISSFAYEMRTVQSFVAYFNFISILILSFVIFDLVWL